MNTQEKIQKRREEALKAQKKNKKRASAKISYKLRNTLITIGVLVVVAAALFALIFPNTAVSRRTTTAVTIGDEKISVAEYSYYYRMAYNNYCETFINYFGRDYLPIDTTKSLTKQQMSDNITYADYFSQGAIDTLTQLVALNKEAEKAGFVMPDEYQEQYEKTLKSVENTAANYGVSVPKYLTSYFGFGFNQKLLEKVVYRELMAEAYQNYMHDLPVYTDEDIEAYYQENAANYEVADVRVVTFKTSPATDTAEAVTSEMAKKDAETFAAGITNESTFAQKALAKAQAEAAEGTTASDTSFTKAITNSYAGSIDPMVASYIFSGERKDGDLEVVAAANEETYFVVYIVKAPYRDENPTVDVRHILIPVADMNDTILKQDALAQASNILETYKNGETTEEAFAALANQFSADTGSNTNGGLYTGVYTGQMIAEFEDWCFAPHQIGDTGLVETQYGYHVMYFVGSSEDPYWKTQVETDMRNGEYNTWYEDTMSKYEAVPNKMGISMRQEPLG